MKKFSLAIVFSLCVVALMGQNIQLSQKSATVYGPVDDLTTSHVTVTNIGNSEIVLKARRYVLQNPTPTANYFCWGLTCYPPQTNVSNDIDVVSLEPAGSNTSFVGYYDPQGVEGVAIVKYCFFNSTNAADSACFEVTYNVTTTGIADNAAAVKFGNPYPNPATNNVSFNYTLPSTGKATVKIYNMLGALVKTAAITDNTGKLSINTADLRSGLYLYDLQLNGKSVKTGKFTVAQ